MSHVEAKVYCLITADYVFICTQLQGVCDCVCVYGFGQEEEEGFGYAPVLRASWCSSSELENSHKHKATCLLTYRVSCICVYVCMCVSICSII